MAAGFVDLETSLALPFGNEPAKVNRANARGVGANPIIAALFPQIMRQLDPQTSRRRTRREFSRAGDQIARGTQGAIDQNRQLAAGRGLSVGGSLLGSEGGIRQQGAQSLGGLVPQFGQRLEQRQDFARQRAMQFLNQVLQQRFGAIETSESIQRRKDQFPTNRGFETVLGDVGGVFDVLGGITDVIGGIGGLF